MTEFKIRCNRCQAEFNPAVKAIPLPDGGERQEFSCFGCGRTYVAAVLTAKGVRLRRRLGVLEGLPKKDLRLIQRTRGALRREVTRPEATT